MKEFTRLDADSSARNMAAWRPVVCDIYRAYSTFPREEFVLHLDVFYLQAVEIIGMETMDSDLRRCLEMFFRRVGDVVVFSKTNGKQKV